MGKEIGIQEVSDLFGLPKSTLRYWEKELCGFFAPTRTAGGQRRYSDADLKIISSICKYKKMGLSLNQIKDHILQNAYPREMFESFQIDLLAKRIAKEVTKEIYKYFERDRHGLGGAHTIENQKE